MPDRIWIVEDDRAIAELYRRILVAHFEAEVVNNREVIRRLSTPCQLPTVIVLDITMSPPTGNDILRRLQQLGAILPVVIVTGDRTKLDDDVRDVPRVVLDKPLQRSAELVENVRTIIEQNGFSRGRFSWLSEIDPKWLAAVIAGVIVAVVSGLVALFKIQQ